MRPSILVFEDVHWADEATLDVLKYLGRRMQGVPAVMILTYRDDEIGQRHPLRLLLGDLATFAATRRIALPPLSEGAVRDLIGDRALDPAALHRQTGGNPFFVTETIASGGQRYSVLGSRCRAGARRPLVCIGTYRTGSRCGDRAADRAAATGRGRRR